MGEGASGIVRRFDGDAWADVDTGIEATGPHFKVWGSSDSDVFVVGESGAVRHWDGAAWTAMDSSVQDRLLTVHGRGPDDVYAVGGQGLAVAVHYDGKRWSSLLAADSELPGLNGVWAGAGGETVISGLFGSLAVERAGTVEELPLLTDRCLHAVWGDGAGGWVAVGGDLLNPAGVRSGVILSRGDVATGGLAGSSGP